MWSRCTLLLRGPESLFSHQGRVRPRITVNLTKLGLTKPYAHPHETASRKLTQQYSATPPNTALRLHHISSTQQARCRKNMPSPDQAPLSHFAQCDVWVSEE